MDALTDAAIRYVDAHQDQPFYLFLFLRERHHQNQTDSYAERYDGRTEMSPKPIVEPPGWFLEWSRSDLAVTPGPFMLQGGRASSEQERNNG